VEFTRSASRTKIANVTLMAQPNTEVRESAHALTSFALTPNSSEAPPSHAGKAPAINTSQNRAESNRIRAPFISPASQIRTAAQSSAVRTPRQRNGSKKSATAQADAVATGSPPLGRCERLCDQWAREADEAIAEIEKQQGTKLNDTQRLFSESVASTGSTSRKVLKWGDLPPRPTLAKSSRRPCARSQTRMTNCAAFSLWIGTSPHRTAATGHSFRTKLPQLGRPDLETHQYYSRYYSGKGQSPQTRSRHTKSTQITPCLVPPKSVH